MVNYTEKPTEKAKERRQRELLAIIRELSVSTQGELVNHLKSRGIPCTQVSVSRDIRELGLIKQGGQYVAPNLPGEEAAFLNLSDNVVAFVKNITVVGDNLIVMKTLPGTAHSVGALLDSLSWNELAGTVAGDDTIFIAVLGGEAGVNALANRLRALIKKGKK